LIPSQTCPDEETLLAFVEGRQNTAIRSTTAVHLDGCESCRDVVAMVAPSILSLTTPDTGPRPKPKEPSALPRGAAVGRYVVLSLVGRGGMGEVYAAYDPELDRKVALKLLHQGDQGGDSAGRARLLREAKAIARLSHPNVVVVHDAGTIDDRVFIAMEFVDGQTLSGWLAARPRTWREVRDIFLDAGRALSAAHAAGLVHRDFKPQNVMVGDDGKVRVMDFGLAAQAGTHDAGEKPELVEGGIDAAALTHTVTVALTRTGTLVGTPAYMAPEQFLAEPADARTDQFSFCVALHEALFGERPFASDSLAVLATAVIGGRVREPAQKGRAPAWIRRLILRGLQTKREQRWPSMDELLRSLGRDPERQRRRLIAVAAAGVLLLGGGAIAQRAASKPAAALCRGAAQRLAGVWEIPAPGVVTPRRDATRVAFVATGKSFADDTWQRAARILDAYAGRWSEMYTSTCEATQVRGEQSAEVMDLRMDCLGQARDSLGALTVLFAKAGPDVVMQAVNAALALPELDRCANVALLRAVTPPPRDPKLRARIDDIRHRAAEAKALHDTGRSGEAMRVNEILVREAHEAGYPPAEADVLTEAGLLNGDLGNPRDAEQMLERAFWLALESRQDERAADATTLLAAIYGDEANAAAEARWERMGNALLTRMGPGHDRTRSWLLQARGNLALVERRFDVAKESFRGAIALKEKALGPDHPDVSRSVDSLSLAQMGAGDLAEALTGNRRAVAIGERAYGRESPLLAYMLSNRGEVLNALHRPEEAEREFRRCLDLWQPALQEDSPSLGYPLTGLGHALLLAGRGAEAVAPLERALHLREKGDPARERLGETRFALAGALAARGKPEDLARAGALARSARADYAQLAASADKLAAVDQWLAAHGSERRLGKRP
jgi:eukaryotic-like serine/threonine-protein kinase